MSEQPDIMRAANYVAVVVLGLFIGGLGLPLGVCLVADLVRAAEPTPAPVDPGPIETTRPPHGLALPCRVVSVHDGDTLTVDVVIRANVRLIDCWAPELWQPGGKDSRDRLRAVADGRPGTLWIPTTGADNLADVLTFGRVAGHVWVDGQARNLSELQVARRQAASRKGAPLGD